MNPRYAPTTPTGRLDRLVEEIGEVSVEAGSALKAIAKSRRFGPDSRHPEGGPTNREDLVAALDRLRAEVLDLYGAVEAVASDLAEGFVEGLRLVESSGAAA